MPGKLIPFPQLKQSTAQNFASPHTPQLSVATSIKARIHLVPPSVQGGERSASTQQKAQKIVAEIRRIESENGGVSVPAMLTERSPQFWATLPLPETVVETPLAVVRRLVHLLVAHPA